MKYNQEIIVNAEQRIDKYLAANTDFSRSDIQKLIEGQAIYVGDMLVRKSNFTTRIGGVIRITNIIEKEIKADAQEMELDIVYEDDDLIVVNKQSGLVVHPAPGHYDQTLVNGLLFHFKNLSDINGSIRPGIVHRIDKDTSGLLIVAKNNKAHQALAEAIKKHEVKRTYLAWVVGKLDNKIMHLNLPIGRDPKDRKKMAVTEINSKEAMTHVYVEKVYEDKTLVRCELETGRTHQIRVHLNYINHPVLGDPIYGSKIDDFGQRLHAHRLEFDHPITNKHMTFEVDPPQEFN